MSVRAQPRQIYPVLAAIMAGLVSLIVLANGVRSRAADQPANAAARPQERERQKRKIEKFIETYFSTWSARQFDRYDACFARNACIQLLDAQQRLFTLSRSQFVAQQRDFAERSPHKMVEVAESVDIRFEAQIARVVVYWKLTTGPRIDYGYDHFTLIREEGGWKIANLLFYGVKRTVRDEKNN